METIETTNIELKEAALEYASKGIRVFVMNKQGQPIKGIHGTTDLIEVEKNWRYKVNIGMPTGEKSGIFVINFDSNEAFADAKVKGLPTTPIVEVGSSYNVFFKYRDDIEDCINKDAVSGMSIVNNYSILPPSVVELHPPSPNYKPDVYTWYEGRSLMDVELAEVPNWMLREDRQLAQEEVEEKEDIIDVTVGPEINHEEQSSAHLPNVNNLEGKWKAPKLFDKYHADEIKADLLPSWLGDYARAISESKQTPEGLAVMLGLSIIATCVQKKFVVAPHGDDEYTEPLALWTLTVMNSGERKSPVLTALREPLVAWQEEQAKLLKDRIIETSTAITMAKARIDKLHKDAVTKNDATERQNILNQINEIKRAMPTEVKAPVLWTGDVTAEELQDMLVEHGERMSLLSDEGNIFAVMAGLYNNDKINIDIFLQAYSGAPTRIDRRSRKAELKNPALTFGIAVQPTVLESFSNGSKKQFRDKGALARFLYCIPESMLGKRDSGRRVPVPEEVKASYQDGIKTLLSIPTPAVPKMLTLDNEAYEAWLSFDRKTEKMIAPGGELQEMADWGGKIPGNLLRIAGLMHLVENDPDNTVPVIRSLDKEVYDTACQGGIWNGRCNSAKY